MKILLDNYLYDIDYVLNNFKKVNRQVKMLLRYYRNGGVIDCRRFTVNDIYENDEYVRVYCRKEFIGTGKIIKNNNTISIKSDKLFIE